ncbi:MAG: hypothetical protein QOC66_1395 [Pseudonocardiales bacterium]|jgi:hypothetical protein|nr:hypothetical protein [Pseudonocardiales bacterium]
MTDAIWCDRCGQGAADGDHAACARARALEPPRYCAQCRRRMVVQVTPIGWTARCVEHGELTSA